MIINLQVRVHVVHMPYELKSKHAATSAVCSDWSKMQADYVKLEYSSMLLTNQIY